MNLAMIFAGIFATHTYSFLRELDFAARLIIVEVDAEFNLPSMDLRTDLVAINSLESPHYLAIERNSYQIVAAPSVFGTLDWFAIITYSSYWIIEVD